MFHRKSCDSSVHMNQQSLDQSVFLSCRSVSCWHVTWWGFAFTSLCVASSDSNLKICLDWDQTKLQVWACCTESNSGQTSRPRCRLWAGCCHRGGGWGTEPAFPEERKQSLTSPRHEHSWVCVCVTLYHSHWAHPFCPLDRRQSQELYGEYLSLWPPAESEEQDLTFNWTLKIFKWQTVEMVSGSYQDFVCRQSLWGDDALQSLKHQSQNFTTLTVLLAAYWQSETRVSSDTQRQMTTLVWEYEVCVWREGGHHRGETPQ